MRDSVFVFKDMPVRRAVISLAVPTVISQIITVIYNMADTFFIGQLNDPGQVAATTVSMPLFIILTALANLFGIGGASKISYCLGQGKIETAKKCASFCFWTSAAVSFVYGIGVYFLCPFLLPLLGADNDTYTFCRQYIFWTVGAGAVPTVLNAELGHLVRSEGYSREAGFGIAFGGVLNILLDPVFIFLFKMEIAGAALATMLSNLCAAVYFLMFIYGKRKTSVININPKNYSVKEKIPFDVILGGLPGFIMMLMSSVSNSVLNKLIAGYSTCAVAGMGIAKKIDMLAFAVSQGMTQGTLPLIGYNYAAENKKRMNQSIFTALVYSFSVSCVITVFLFLFAGIIPNIFIKDPETVGFGHTFLRIICFVCPSSAINFMIITVFQATKEKVKPLILSLLRKGTIDVVLMLLLNRISGIIGVAWASPAADWTALVISLCLFVPYIKKLNAKELKQPV